MAGPFFVDSDFGLDANSGLASSSPKKTLAAAVALFDASTAETLYVNGTFRNEVIALTSNSNKTITQMPAVGPTDGQPWALPGGSTVRQAVLRGDRLTVGSWTGIGNGVYTLAIAPSLNVSAITYGWDTHATTAIGQHKFGMVRVASAAAVTTYATGTGGAKGVVYYESTATGLITAYFGGDDPNASGHAVGYITAEATLAAIRMVTCAACVVSSINFALWTVYGGQFGWAMRWEGSTGCAIIGCTFDDMGRHIAGTIGGSGNSSGNTIANCVFRGMTPTDANIVFNGINSEGALTGTVSGCTIYLTRWLGIDGNYAHGQLGAVGAFAVNTQTGVYAHADTGNTAISLIAINGTTIVNVEKVGDAKPIAADNAVAVATGSRRAFSAYPMQADGCTITDFLSENIAATTASIAYRRSAIGTTCPAATGFGAAGVVGQCNAANSANYLRLYEECSIRMDLTGAVTRAFNGQGSTGGMKRFSFINCSFSNFSVDAANNHSFFDPATEAVVYFETVGCNLSHVTADATNRVMIFDRDPGMNAGDHLDNLYFNMGEYGHQSSYVTAAQWVAGIDTSATVAVNVLAATPYASNTTLALVTSAQSLRRVTTTVVPSCGGINGVAYSGNFGDWQYLAPGSITGRNTGRQPGADRLSRSAR